VAWVLVRYQLPALIDLPFALPTAVAGIALTSLSTRLLLGAIVELGVDAHRDEMQRISERDEINHL
jgi:sulfate transport system permease protein